MPWFRPHPQRPELTIVIPFHDNEEERTRVFRWLLRFWECHLSDAQIIIADYDGLPFSKALAVNEGVRHARGRVLALLDADCYMDPRVIEGCAHRIARALDQHQRLWYVPYRNLYRLNRHVTEEIIHSDPCRPFEFPCPPPGCDLEDHSGNEGYGHRYGAMAMVMPREAFFLVGGFDPRFCHGWGGEDSSMVVALDTLYGLHQNTPNETLHLWHRRIGELDDHANRKWQGQALGNVHTRLAQRYQIASSDPTMMQALVDERTK